MIYRPSRIGARWYPAAAVCAKRESPIRAEAKENVEATATCTYICKASSNIHLLILLDKNEQEDASEEQRKQMREWPAKVKKSSGG